MKNNRQGSLVLAWLGIVLAAGLVSLGVSLLLNKPVVQPHPFGQTGVVQAQSFSLSGSGINTTATSVVLTSFKLPDASTTILMANFSEGIGYATLEPGSSREEQISFTGVTQNSDGTANLTGVTRGLNFVSPCNSVSSYQKSHAGGTRAVLSNTSCFYSRFPGINSTTTVSAVWTFSSTAVPVYDSAPTFNNNLMLVDKTYADAIGIGGAPAASTQTGGLVVDAWQTSLINGSSSYKIGTTTYTMVVPSQFVNAVSQTTSTIPIANVLQNSLYVIDPSFIATSSNYTWSGNNNYIGTSSFTGSSTFTGQVVFGSTTFNNFPVLPSSDPTGTQPVTYSFAQKNRLQSASQSTVSTSTCSSVPTTMGTSSIIQGLGKNDMLDVTVFSYNNQSGASSYTLYASGTMLATSSAAVGANMQMFFKTYMRNSTSSEVTNWYSIVGPTASSSGNTIANQNLSNPFTIRIDCTNPGSQANQTLDIFDVEVKRF